MTTNDSPLRAALDKVAALEFTEAEAEALKALLERGVESDDEVAGFGMSPLRDGRPFAVEISGLKMGDPTVGNAKLGPGQNETFRLGFTLNEELLGW